MMIFLSTLPARGATETLAEPCRTVCISIHAPREGSDLELIKKIVDVWKFLSTLPARGATRWGTHRVPGRGISIHAPREGSDVSPQRRHL